MIHSFSFSQPSHDLQVKMTILQPTRWITGCSCDECGTRNCDHFSGSCDCFENVIGEDCDRCAPNHWGFASCQVSRRRMIKLFFHCNLSGLMMSLENKFHPGNSSCNSESCVVSLSLCSGRNEVVININSKYNFLFISNG